MERWQKVDGFNGYEVSNIGRVRSYRTHTKGVNTNTPHILNLEKSRNGYLRVRLSGKKMLVHRLVATAFISNPSAKPMINHKDGNRLNNNIANLEWCTNSENQIHARVILGCKQGGVAKRPVRCIETSKTFKSIHEASRATGINATHICNSAHGRRNRAGGYHWAYLAEPSGTTIARD